MDSDKQLYEIFEVNPQWIFELTGRPSPGPCRFISVTVKAIERRADGVLVPDAFAEAISVTELQMQFNKLIYGRVVIEMAMVQAEHTDRIVDGIIIFASRELDPRTEPWCNVVSAYYLDEMLEQLAIRTPNHPLAAVFQPLVEKNRDLLERNAAKYYNQIRVNAPDERTKSKLLAVFVDWVMQRFNDRGKQEIEKMLLGELPDLRDTQAGKDLIAIGVEQGIEQGIEQGSYIGTIRSCQSILGVAPSNETELRAKSIDELTEIANVLQALIRNRLGTT